MNSLFSVLGGNDLAPIVKQFQQFKNSFSGDPQKQVQSLLSSGRVSQAQYDRAVQLARQFQSVLNGR